MAGDKERVKGVGRRRKGKKKKQTSDGGGTGSKFGQPRPKTVFFVFSAASLLRA